MSITAALLPDTGAAIEVREVELAAPGPGEALRASAGALDLVRTGDAGSTVLQLN